MKLSVSYANAEFWIPFIVIVIQEGAWMTCSTTTLLNKIDRLAVSYRQVFYMTSVETEQPFSLSLSPIYSGHVIQI